MRQPFEGVVSRIDRVPFPWAVAVGLEAGLAVAAVIAALPPVAGLAAAVVVIALAGTAAWSAQPVGIWEVGEDEEAKPFLDMVAIEGGSFVMGSPEDEPGRSPDERRHEVTLSPFRMSRTTVTRAQYREVMGLDEAPGPGSDDGPVTEVDWLEAVGFCNRLSEREDLPPCYRIDGKEVSWIEDAGGYRLPTEAEWEYSARAGTTTAWSFGGDESALGDFAWYGGNSGNRTHQVATLKPNPWGLFDMHGNVWEWCWDGYAEYPAEHVTDPRGPASRSAPRVLRGGSAWVEPGVLRSAYRPWFDPEFRDEAFGFRCVRRPRRQP